MNQRKSHILKCSFSLRSTGGHKATVAKDSGDIEYPLVRYANQAREKAAKQAAKDGARASASAA
jgi:hypothetical protein